MKTEQVVATPAVVKTEQVAATTTVVKTKQVAAAATTVSVDSMRKRAADRLANEQALKALQDAA